MRKYLYIPFFFYYFAKIGRFAPFCKKNERIINNKY